MNDKQVPVSNKKKYRVVIVGAGIAGTELAEEIDAKLKAAIEIVGFVDDDPAKTDILGYQILGRTDDLSEIIRSRNIDQVYIAIPSGKGSTVSRIIDQCNREKVVFRIVPRILEIVQGKVRLGQVREIGVEDLLGREIIQSEQAVLKQEFQGKRILVTGAAGSIGSELCRQLMQFKPKILIGYDWWENGIFELEMDLKEGVNNVFCGVIGNIQDNEKFASVVRDFQPDIVFHAAAFKHVPLMQRYPEEAIRNNVLGTYNVVRVCSELGVGKLVYISTDKAADPKNIMGATKWVGERIVQNFTRKGKIRSSIVRFGNVLDSHGSVVPIFRKQIASGGPVTVTDKEMTRFFMTIPEAVQLVLQASLLGAEGDVFILDMGEQVKIDDLAHNMIKLAGYVPDEDIKIVYTGIRLGEKLNEKLVNGDEVLEKTENKKIFKVSKKEDSMDIDGLLYRFEKLEKEEDGAGMIVALKEAVPTLIDR